MTMLIPWTKGPWQVCPKERAEHQWVVGDSEGGSIASCEPMGPWMSEAEADANTRLIACAPEFYEALTAALPMLDENARFLRDIQADSGKIVIAFQAADQVRAVLLKVRGEA